jgi:hypothetical protein
MSREKSFEAYGRYLVVRDRLNAVLDAAIIQETQLRVFHGVLLVAQLNTKNRIGILKAVLGQAGGEKAALAPLVSEIAQELKRQPIGQSQASLGANDGLSFMRTEVGPRTAGMVVDYSAEEIAAAADLLERATNALATALGIDDAALASMQRSVVEALSKRGPGGEEEA